MESMKFGLMAVLWLLVASMVGRLFQNMGILDGSFFHGLLGTAFRYLGWRNSRPTFSGFTAADLPPAARRSKATCGAGTSTRTTYRVLKPPSQLRRNMTV
jgi:hypothetical protein